MISATSQGLPVAFVTKVKSGRKLHHRTRGQQARRCYTNEAAGHVLMETAANLLVARARRMTQPRFALDRFFVVLAHLLNKSLFKNRPVCERFLRE
jgi:hypothetical protein